jgi:anti-sigma factor RsiW
MFFQCYFIRRKLLDYYEGSLSPQQKESVEKHLSQCPSCTGHAYTLRKTQKLVGELEDNYRPPEDYWSTVWERLRKKLFEDNKHKN